jgi:hypothetical protein
VPSITQSATTNNVTLTNLADVSTTSFVGSTYVDTTTTLEAGAETTAEMPVLTTVETLSPSTQPSLNNLSLSDTTSNMPTNTPQMSSSSSSSSTVEESTNIASNQMLFTTAPTIINTTTLVGSTQTESGKSL